MNVTTINRIALSLALATLAVFCFRLTPAHAAPLTWDTVQGDGAAITGGNGTWSNSGVNWNTGAGDTTWNNATPDTATFGATAGIATLGSNITTAGITFNTTGYTINQDAGNLFALTIGTGGVNLTTGVSATINAKLTGNNAWSAFRASGNGTLTLGGNVANDSTGTITTILPGHLILAKTGGVAATAGNLVLNNNPVHLELGNQSIGGATEFQSGFNARLHPRGLTYTTRGLISASSAVGVIENSSTFSTGPNVLQNGTGVITIATQSGDSFSYAGIIRNTDVAGGGTIAIVKEGAGTQTFVGTNALLYTGTTTINGGTLRIDLSGTSGSGGFASAVNIGGSGTLELRSNATTTPDNTYFNTTGLNVTGTGTITKTGAGYFGLLFNGSGGVKDFQGYIDVQQGILGTNGTAWSAGAGAMDLNIASGAMFDIRTGHAKVDALTGSGTIGSSFSAGMVLTVGTQGSSSQFDGVIQNTVPGFANAPTVGLTKTGIGTFTLTGVNSYTGVTTISDGVLRLGNAAALGSTAGNTTIAGGATLDLNGQTIAEPIGAIAGAGFGANGALINTSGAPASITGTISAGTSSFTVGAGDITLATVAGTNTFTITKIGAGTLTLGGTSDNSFAALNASGGTVVLAKSSSGSVHALGRPVLVNGGILQLGGTGGDQIFDHTAAGVTVSSGTLDINTRNETIGGLSLTGGSITGTTGVLTLGAGATTYDMQAGSASAILAGSVSLSKTTSGVVTLSGANTYSGATNVNNGTLLVNGPHAGGGLYTVANNATLGGTGSTSAPVTVQSGGKFAPGSSLGPGDIGTGNLLLSGGSIFEVNLDGVLAGTQYDQVDVTGSVNVTGSFLDVILGFVPSVGNSFTIIDNNDTDAVIGTFSGLPEGSVFYDGNQQWSISYVGGTGNDVVLIATPEPSTLVCSLFSLLAVGLFAWRHRCC